MSDAPLAFLDRGDGIRLAYRLRSGAQPTPVFLPGYASDMDGAKALALDRWAAERGRSVLRLDYSGTGRSDGSFETGSLDIWLRDAAFAVDTLAPGPLLLVGSSMGGWIALHLALRHPHRVRAILGIAAAPDFTDWGFTDRQKARLSAGETLRRQRPEGGEQVTTAAFWRSGEVLRLLEDELAVDCPVRLVHGDCDDIVPLDVPVRAKDRLRSSDVQLLVLKGGGHRLSEPREIDAILHTLGPLVEQCA
jgi:pimeloyl-ACP methyl ester carboxylesterase